MKKCAPGQYYCNTDQMCKPIPNGYKVNSDGMLVKESELLKFKTWIYEESGLAAKAKKSGVPLRILKTVFRRGVAAWNSGHRPGTTPQQWGHARVNSYITKGKTYHTADKDLREEAEQIKGKADVMESENVYMPSKYKTGKASTDKARVAHWKKMSRYSDRDPRAYQDAPGDKKARKEGIPVSKYTKKYKKMFGEQKAFVNERFEEHFRLINNSIENQE